MESFVHEAFFYRGRDEFLAATVPFIEKGLAQDEPVLAATQPANLSRLRAALGTTVSQLHLVDLVRAGRNPGRILPAVLLAFVHAHAGRRVWMISEATWPGRSDLEYPACVQHEALANVAAAETEAIMRCPYDAESLPPTAITDAERTHPVVFSPEGSHPSTQYADPFTVAEECNLPLSAPPADAVTFPVAIAQLAGLRQFVAEQGEKAGLPAARIADAIIAANELASNTLDHDGGPGTLACWTEADHLVCQLDDHGHIGDPLAGRLPPGAEALAGRGLYVVNQLCDLVRIHTRPGRTTIRVLIGPGEGAPRLRW
ncbi:sensor histidine kinase [Natronosporangium hydrolyticum]|uniref:Sensor histidine kinase n=1 Tax=Natronosporangium hydrolyticum TaxID=2811111 RepID=A0A895YPS6_9ACTN|nr:sensor histidine kinase [Natronosporangium hydrolyticum]QSB17489.1 sensor histidine kinase [Natronosporangium hydrolyticum]